MSLENHILTSEQAHQMSEAGDILLIDVRREDEWLATGLAPYAKAITMSDPEFLEKIEDLTEQNKDKSIAIICAAGGRSAHMCNALINIGYNSIYDVSEGMSGWVSKALPTSDYKSA